MITTIAGSRTITDIRHVRLAVERCGWEITAVVSGCARGVDMLAIEFAKAEGLPYIEYTVTARDWAREGKAAGVNRSREMIRCSEGLIAVWDGYSRGTKHTIGMAQRSGINLYIHLVDAQARLW